MKAIANGDTEQELVCYIDNYHDTITKYFCIYKYKSDEYFFNGTQKAIKYGHVRTIRGKQNAYPFPFRAMNYALLFDNETNWFYQSN